MNLIHKKYYFKKEVFIWLVLLLALVFSIIIVGGLTRLTDSGLSMVNWQPILGTIPPLTKDQWLKIFELYQNSPEYIYINSDISLNEFKYIFWWEWGHRVIARFIGIFFFFPFIYFVFKKYLNRKLIYKLLLALIFGIFQALVGWWMVKSGLTDDPYVSAYRLTFHLMNALIIFSLLLWTCMDYYYLEYNKKIKNFNSYEVFLLFSLILVIITVISGGFMAGTHAGQSFNTYPLMSGKVIPDDYFIKELGMLNFFENTIAINFNHRWLATFTFLYTFSFFTYSIVSEKQLASKKLFFLVLFILILQFILGVLTLLSNVNINYASLHQTNSVILIGLLIITYHDYKIKKNLLNDQKMS